MACDSSTREGVQDTSWREATASATGSHSGGVKVDGAGRVPLETNEFTLPSLRTPYTLTPEQRAPPHRPPDLANQELGELYFHFIDGRGRPVAGVLMSAHLTWQATPTGWASPRCTSDEEGMCVWQPPKEAWGECLEVTFSKSERQGLSCEGKWVGRIPSGELTLMVAHGGFLKGTILNVPDLEDLGDIGALSWHVESQHPGGARASSEKDALSGTITFRWSEGEDYQGTTTGSIRANQYELTSPVAGTVSEIEVQVYTAVGPITFTMLPRDLTVIDDEQRVYDVSLDRIPALALTLVDAETLQPVSHVMVRTLDGYCGETDQDGRCLVPTGLSPRRPAFVMAEHPQYVPLRQPISWEPLDVQPGSDSDSPRVLHTLRLDRGITIHARVVDSRGQPLPLVQVECTLSPGNDLHYPGMINLTRSTITDGNGWFRLVGLIESPSYELCLTKAVTTGEGDPQPIRFWIEPDFGSIQRLQDAKQSFAYKIVLPRDVDVREWVFPDRTRVVVHVTSPSGTPIQGVSVRAHRGTVLAGSRESMTSADGSVVLNLEPGACYLMADREPRGEGALSVRRGKEVLIVAGEENAITLVMPDLLEQATPIPDHGAVLEIDVTDSQTGQRLDQVNLSVGTSGSQDFRELQATSAQGYARLWLPLGSYTVRVWVPGHTPWTRDVEIVSNGITVPVQALMTLSPAPSPPSGH